MFVFWDCDCLCQATLYCIIQFDINPFTRYSSTASAICIHGIHLNMYICISLSVVYQFDSGVYVCSAPPVYLSHRRLSMNFISSHQSISHGHVSFCSPPFIYPFHWQLPTPSPLPAAVAVGSQWLTWKDSPSHYRCWDWFYELVLCCVCNYGSLSLSLSETERKNIFFKTNKNQKDQYL